MLNQIGAASDYLHSFHSVTVPMNAQALTEYGLKYIHQTPMFNPLQEKTTFATPTTGIVDSHMKMHGGGKDKDASKVSDDPYEIYYKKLKTEELYAEATKRGIDTIGPDGKKLKKKVLINALLGRLY